MMTWQPGQVSDEVGSGVKLDAELLQPSRRKRGELLPQSQFVQQSQRGGMHGVTTKIAEEVRMLL
jgi:hypothetical protein